MEALGRRLVDVAARYRRDTGVDVTTVPGAGAAGGLAGGLVALGARIEPGFDFVAGLVGLAGRMERADLVVTGEGHLDPPSFHGKVPGGVLELARARGRRGRPLDGPVHRGRRRRGVAGRAAPGHGGGEPHRALRTRQRPGRRTAALIDQVTAEALARFCP